MAGKPLAQGMEADEFIPDAEADDAVDEDPFLTFTEWGQAEDEAAFADL